MMITNLLLIAVTVCALVGWHGALKRWGQSMALMRHYLMREQILLQMMQKLVEQMPPGPDDDVQAARPEVRH